MFLSRNILLAGARIGGRLLRCCHLLGLLLVLLLLAAASLLLRVRRVVGVLGRVSKSLLHVLVPQKFFHSIVVSLVREWVVLRLPILHELDLLVLQRVKERRVGVRAARQGLKRKKRSIIICLLRFHSRSSP